MSARVAPSRARKAAVAIAAAAALLVSAQYAYVVLHTLDYPFHLEWMEGGMLEVSARVRDGMPIYVAPTVDYVPYVYPPLYFVAVAGASFVTGLDLVAGRLVSLLSVIAACVLLGRMAQRETGQRWSALIAVALYLATYEASGRWLHLARLDSLYVALLLGGLYLLRFGVGAWSAAAGGAILVLAVLTKQTALLVAAPVVLALFFVDARRAAAAGGALLGGTLAAFLALTAATDGWFLYYVVELPSQHALAPLEATRFLGGHLLFVVPALAVAGWVLSRRPREDRRSGLFHLGAAAGMAGSAWLGLAHTGGYLNVLMPLYAWLALLVAMGLAAARGPRGTWVAVGALLLQLALLLRPTAGSLPPPGAVAQGQRFLAHLRELDGEVLLPDHRFVQRRAGLRSHGLGMAARDVLRADPDDPGRRMFEQSLAHAFGEGRFRWVVLSQPDYLAGFMDLFHTPAGTLEGPPHPVTGEPLTPRHLWRSR